MKVRKETLLFVASIVWMMAGGNILRIGVQSFVTLGLEGAWSTFALSFGASLLVFVGFFFMFRKVVNRHSRRILSYEEARKSVFLFFDLKGYLLMAFMMALGITLRSIDLLPTAFFAAFYLGLGTALAVGGVRFIIKWLPYAPKGKKDLQEKEGETAHENDEV